MAAIDMLDDGELAKVLPFPERRRCPTCDGKGDAHKAWCWIGDPTQPNLNYDPPEFIPDEDHGREGGWR